MTERMALLGGSLTRRFSRLSPQNRSRSPRVVILLLSVLSFAHACSRYLSAVPLTRLLEDALCRQSISQKAVPVPIDEQSCKTTAIQSELAYLSGLMEAIEAAIGITGLSSFGRHGGFLTRLRTSADALSGLLVAMPYGVLSDSNGRRPVLLLYMGGHIASSAWTGLVLSRWGELPLRMVLLSPVLCVVGGGRSVLFSTIYSAASDVTSDEDRASSYFTIMVGSLTATLVGPVISSALMKSTSPWLPYLIGIGTMFFGVAALLLMPETLQHTKPDGHKAEPVDDAAKPKGYWRFLHCFEQLRHFADLLRQPALAILLVVFLALEPTWFATQQFFAQFVSKRFHWSLADAGYLLSLRGVVNSLVLLVILPGLSSMVRSPRAAKPRSAAEKDRILAQASAVALSLGCLLMASDSIYVVVLGLVVNTLGAGIGAMCRSLAVYLIDTRHTAKLQTLIGMTDSLGSLFAGPAMAALLSAGMARGGLWMGLPYFGLGVFLSVTTLVPLFLPQDCVASSLRDDRGTYEALGGSQGHSTAPHSITEGRSPQSNNNAV